MTNRIPADEILLTIEDLALRWGRSVGALYTARSRGNVPEPDYVIRRVPLWTEKTIRSAERANPNLSRR